MAGTMLPVEFIEVRGQGGDGAAAEGAAVEQPLA